MKSNNVNANILNFDCLVESPMFNDWELPITEQDLPLINEHNHQALQLRDVARDYLDCHYGIKGELIDKFGIGFSNRVLIDKTEFVTKPLSNQQYSNSFINMETSPANDVFAGYVTVPIYQDDELVGYYCEAVPVDGYYCGQGSWACTNGSNVFNLDNCSNQSTLYVFENPLKAISMMPVLNGGVIAAESSLNQNDLIAISNQGVTHLVICHGHDLPSAMKAQIALPFMMLGFQVSFEQDIEEVVYGTA